VPAHEIGIWLGAAKPRALALTGRVADGWAAPAPAADTDEAIVGPPDHWAEVLTHLALDIGFGTFVLMGQPDPQMLRTFIEDVAPRVRERVATARTGAGVR
jgi:alkanesulfonate monooxygenase SsuD/methylene tetrahydromethanopterin reductase-like flavin-dependent oxidoreductase (luciferase family)